MKVPTQIILIFMFPGSISTKISCSIGISAGNSNQTHFCFWSSVKEKVKWAWSPEVSWTGTNGCASDVTISHGCCIFHPGQQMYWNHPDERDIGDVSGAGVQAALRLPLRLAPVPRLRRQRKVCSRGVPSGQKQLPWQMQFDAKSWHLGFILKPEWFQLNIDTSDSSWNHIGFNSVERENCYLDSLLWYWNQCGFKMNPRCQLVWIHCGCKMNPKSQLFPAIRQLKMSWWRYLCPS